VAQELKDIDLTWHISAFIKNFLQNNTSELNWRNYFWLLWSRSLTFTNSVLSTMLFTIKMHQINKQIAHNVQNFLFVDDFAAGYASTNMNIIEHNRVVVSVSNVSVPTRSW